MRISLLGRCICALVISLSAEGASAADHCAETEAAGKLISVEGRVEIQRAADQGWRPAVLQQHLCLGDTIRVANRSRAAVILSDGWIERFDQNSAMRFVQISVQDERSILDLLYGAVLFFSRSSRSLDIVTPYANAAVEGTEFVIRVEAGQTVVTVFEGRVVAANELGRLVLESGKSAVAEAGKAPEPRLVVRPRDAVHWSLFYPPILAALDGRTADGPAGMAEALRQAIRHAASGDFVGAFATLEQFPEANHDAQFYLLRAAFLLAVGQVTEAGADINRALAQDPQAGLGF
ncbi:MAG: FecR family protein, partial [Alphaproteobacteria bacterium]|nr:FecR family protein [Alphaproteobacteria bacterium]